MKKLFPFIITGLLSAGIALGIFSILDKPTIVVENTTPKAVLMNQAPFTNSATLPYPTQTPDLVIAANMSKEAVVYIESRTLSTSGYFSRRS